MRKAQISLIWRFLLKQYTYISQSNSKKREIEVELISHYNSDTACGKPSKRSSSAIGLLQIMFYKRSLSLSSKPPSDSYSDLFAELYFLPSEPGYYEGCLKFKFMLLPHKKEYFFELNYSATVLREDLLSLSLIEKQNKKLALSLAISTQFHSLSSISRQCRSYKEPMLAQLHQTRNEKGNVKETTEDPIALQNLHLQNIKELWIFDAISPTPLGSSLPVLLQKGGSPLEFQVPFSPEVSSNQIFHQILLLTQHGVLRVPVQVQTVEFICVSENNFQEKLGQLFQKCSDWTDEDFFNQKEPLRFYILNFSPYYRRVQAELKAGLRTVLFRKSLSLHNARFLNLEFSDPNSSPCVWLPPNSATLVEFIVNYKKFQYHLKFPAVAHFTQTSRRLPTKNENDFIKAQGNSSFNISFKIRQKRGQIKLSPPQVQFSQLLPAFIHEQVLMLESSYDRKISVKSVTCDDIRVSLSLLSQVFEKGSPTKRFLKVSVNLSKSLLSPGLARLQHEMDPFSPPTLEQLFIWKRLRNEWQFLKQKDQLHLSASILVKFDNDIELKIPLRGEFRLPSLLKENSRLLYGQRAMKQGTDISEWNKIVFTNPSKVYVGLSLWLAPTQFASMDVLEHQEFYISQYDSGLNARMIRGRIQRAIRNLIPYCQERPAELQKQLHKQKLGLKQSCMEDIKDELGLDFQGLHVLEVQTNSIEINKREHLHRQPPEVQRMNRFDIMHENAHFSQSPGGLGLTIRGASFFSREQDFKINLPFQEQLLQQASTDLFFNSHNPRQLILAPGESLTVQDVLFYYPTSESFNATLFVKNNYSLFDSIPLIAKPIEFSLVVTHLGSLNCSQTCHMQYTPTKSKVVLFSITLDQIQHHSSYPAVAEWKGRIAESSFSSLMPQVLRTRKILKPLVRRKLVIENQSEMALQVLKIELSGGCGNQLFWMSPCPIQEPFLVQRGKTFELVLSSRADSVLLQGYTQFYIQTDKMDFFLGVVYQADEAVLRARQEEQLSISLTFYKALFLVSLVGIAFVTGLTLHSVKMQKQEEEEHANKFWNMVAVNQKANAEPLFHITPGLLFEEQAEEEEERSHIIKKKKPAKKPEKKPEKQERESAYNSEIQEPRKKREASPESASTTSGTTSARKKKEQRYSSVETSPPTKKTTQRKKSSQSETTTVKQEESPLEEEGWQMVGKRSGKRIMTEPKQPIKSPRGERPKKPIVKKSEPKKKEEAEQKSEIIETEVVPFKPPRYTEQVRIRISIYKGMSGWTVRYQKKKREQPPAPVGFQNQEAFPKLGEQVVEKERKPKPGPPPYQTKSLFNFSSPVLTAQQSQKEEKPEEVKIKQEYEKEEVEDEKEEMKEQEDKRYDTEDEVRSQDRQGSQGSIWASIIPTKRKNSASDSGRKWGPGGEKDMESDDQEETSEEDGGELLSELRETSEKVERHESGF